MSSRPYSPKTFFRRIPNHYFARFFEERALLSPLPIDWATFDERDAGAFLAAV